ncbi:MAG TPA: hypothetical protein VJT71_05685 [Pyrinomonadaceae bacterium]|nr:hypothetical protein [Pyrinomonadaceae bacterium]
MRNLGKIPSRDIEEALIADADNVDAWDEPINVAASKSTRPDWYGPTGTLIGMTLANCGGVKGDEVYEFIAHNVPGTSAYAFRPKGPATAALDFYLVLGAIASVTSIANVLWMAYDRFIAPRKQAANDSAGIYIAVQLADGEVTEIWLGRDVSTKEEFFRRLADLAAEANDPQMRPTHDAKLREIQESDSWVKINQDT